MATEKQLKVSRENIKKGEMETTRNKVLVKKDRSMKATTIRETGNYLDGVTCLFDYYPEGIVREVEEGLKRIEKDKKDIKKLSEAAEKVLIMEGLDTHYPLTETIGKRYRPLAIEFNRQLLKEYNCQTSSEKALAQVIVNAYIRILEYSQLLYTCQETNWLSSEKNGFYSMLSKELDRANRQFITTLTTLKQVKTPSLEVNVKTRATFVAQNQQLNINPPEKGDSKKNENIEPK